MPTEVVCIHGQKVEILRELLRPGLSAIFVGLNPSPVSVQAGHYWALSANSTMVLPMVTRCLTQSA